MNRKGFSLIELLVVIAIIAILAALLFPTFQQVRNRTRETQCMTQMHDVYTALKVYKEDNNRYPAALFGFAEDGSGNLYTGSGAVNNISALHYKPLFKKKYLNDNAKFQCPVTKDKNQTTVTTAVYPVGTPLSGTSVIFNSFVQHNMGLDGAGSFPLGNSVYYYKYDNYDVQPMPNPTLDGPDPSGNYEVHYSLNWSMKQTSPTDPITSPADFSTYPNQMKYADKADESHTVMTWCSEHALNANSDKVLVLTLSGQTKVVDKKAFYSKGPLNILK